MNAVRLTARQPYLTIVAFREVAGAGRKCMEVELLLLLFHKKTQNKQGNVSLPLPFLDMGGEKQKIKPGSKE